MNIKTSVFVATSLDGFIARKDGNLDWLDKANESFSEGEDGGFKAFMNSIDAIVMGRNTFEKVLTFGVPWPYTGRHVFVLSHRKLEIPDNLKDAVSHSSGSPESILRTLSDKGFKHIYVDGGITVQRFLAAGLIDFITITVIPVLIGEGLSLFGPLEKDVSLELVNSREFGVLQVTYKVKV